MVQLHDTLQRSTVRISHLSFPCMMHQQYNCCAMIRLSVQWNFFVWEYFFRAITHPFSSNKFTQQKYTLIPPCFVVSQARPFPFLSTDRFQYTYYML